MKDTPKAMRHAFGEALVKLGDSHPELVVLDADVSHSTQTVHFGNTFPERFFNVGVAETNMVDMAAGMAASGLRPVASTFALFLALKGAEQIRNSISYNQLPVILAGGYAGLSDSFDGASHQAITDLAVMRALPGMQVIVPFDPGQVQPALELALSSGGPTYIRLCRNPVPGLPEDAWDGRLQSLYRITADRNAGGSSSLTLVACGVPAFMAYQAYLELNGQGFGTDLFLVTTLKPFNGEEIYHSLESTGRLLTVEEHHVTGGLKSTVLENAPSGLSFAHEAIGMQDTFGESGPYPELLAKYGISKEVILTRSRSLITSTPTHIPS